MGRTAPGRRIELNGTYAGRPCVEQTEAERAAFVGGFPPSGQRDENQDVLYPPDNAPTTSDDVEAKPKGRPEKGSAEAKRQMARVRAMRGKAKTSDNEPDQSTETPDDDE